MAKRPMKSETALLEKWRVALQNAKEQPEIATEIAKYGYDNAKIQEGLTLFEQTKQIWDFKQKEDQETKEATINFKNPKTPKPQNPILLFSKFILSKFRFVWTHVGFAAGTG